MSETILENSRFYQVEGATTGVILFHAYTGSPNDFLSTARFLQRAGIEVLCPTFKGHGTDDIYDILEAHPDQWWEQAQAALHYMQGRQYERLFVFGLSLGGIFATRLLTENHQANLAGGVFNSPVFTAQQIDVGYFFEQYARHLYEKQNRLDDYQVEKDRIMSLYREQIESISYFAMSFYMELSQITSRFYLAQSGEDEMIDPEDAYLVRDALTGAQEVYFQWFEHNTHVITTNRERSAFEQSLLAFIQR